jgi:hypothetical protein
VSHRNDPLAAAIKRRAVLGMTAPQIARELQVTPECVRAMAARRGIRLAKQPRGPGAWCPVVAPSPRKVRAA